MEGEEFVNIYPSGSRGGCSGWRQLASRWRGRKAGKVSQPWILCTQQSCELEAMISPILQMNRDPFLSSKGHPSGSPSLNSLENLQLPLL